MAGRLGLWFHVAFYPSIVLFVGMSEKQVLAQSFAEMISAYNSSLWPIGGQLLTKKLKTEDEHHSIEILCTNDPNRVQGFHRPNVFLILSEAQGYPRDMHNALNSLMTAVEMARLFQIGNAFWLPDSAFYDSFHGDANINHCITLDSERSSHCSKAWIEEMETKHGRDSDEFRARVKGIFPKTRGSVLISRDLIEAAQARWKDTPKGPIVDQLGIDVADQGDDHTCAYERRGIRLECVHKVQGDDGMVTAGWAKAHIQANNIEPTNVLFDETGGYGRGPVVRLREQDIPVRGLNFGAKPKEVDAEKEFVNIRTQIAFALRDLFKDGLAAIDPEDKELAAQLSVQTYTYKSNGKKILVPKDRMKVKLGRSPDEFDACCLAAFRRPYIEPDLTDREEELQPGLGDLRRRRDLRDERQRGANRLKGYRKKSGL